jgi:flagellar biosynthesis/type III secretory pathway M-ring protein FliF/YscJ
MQTPGGVKRISAAVFVAASATGSGTNRVVAARTPEEMQKIKRVVMGALGIQEGPDATRPDLITIEEMPFNEEPALEIAKQLDQQQKKDFWWDLAKHRPLSAARLCGAVPVLAHVQEHAGGQHPARRAPRLGRPLGAACVPVIPMRSPSRC